MQKQWLPDSNRFNEQRQYWRDCASGSKTKRELSLWLFQRNSPCTTISPSSFRRFSKNWSRMKPPMFSSPLSQSKNQYRKPTNTATSRSANDNKLIELAYFIVNNKWYESGKHILGEFEHWNLIGAEDEWDEEVIDQFIALIQHLHV